MFDFRVPRNPLLHRLFPWFQKSLDSSLEGTCLTFLLNYCKNMFRTYPDNTNGIASSNINENTPKKLDYFSLLNTSGMRRNLYWQIVTVKISIFTVIYFWAMSLNCLGSAQGEYLM